MGNPNQLECLIALWPLTFSNGPHVWLTAMDTSHLTLGLFGDRHFHSNRLHEIQAGLRGFPSAISYLPYLNSLQSSHNGCNTLIPYKKSTNCWVFVVLLARFHVEIAWVLFKPKPCCLRRQFAPHRHELWPATLRRWGMRKTTLATLKRERWSSGSIESIEYMSLSL